MSALPPLPKAQSQATDSTTDLIDEGLTNVDAQRIMSILNELEKKVQLLDMLPPHTDKKVTSVFDLATISLIKVNFENF
jgi:hypothetical protein